MVVTSQPPIGTALADQISDGITKALLPDYVYSYPPRQTFRSNLKELADCAFISQALADTPENFNLYLHFPFCRQICGFCNLYAVAGAGDELVEEYIHAVCSEIKYYGQQLPELPSKTLYFGGGTPSLLTLFQLETVLDAAERAFPGSWTKSEELCLEVAPDTLDDAKAMGLRSLGFTRLTLGVQTLDNTELNTIGRRHSTTISYRAIECALSSGVRDVCVDLINGIPAQTSSSWRNSVREVVAIRPPTICVYNFTARVATGFSARRLTTADSRERYDRYRLAQEIILSAGYEQETNVRYVIPERGGYRQKTNHWRGGTIAGFGAGARTYTPLIHYNNGYSAIHRRATLMGYLHSIRQSRLSRVAGFLLNSEERLRQKIILSCPRVESSDIQALDEFLGCQETSRFFEWLASEGFLRASEQGFSYTSRGFMYRDLIVGALFSHTVRQRVAEYDYCT